MAKPETRINKKTRMTNHAVRAFGHSGLIRISGFRIRVSRGFPTGSLLPEDDPSPGQVVGAEFDFDAVAGEDADEMLAHFARHDAEDLAVAVVQTELEHRV